MKFSKIGRHANLGHRGMSKILPLESIRRNGMLCGITNPANMCSTPSLPKLSSLLLLLLSAHSFALTYNVVNLGAATDSYAIAINEIGDVVGTNGSSGFFWRNGTLTNVGALAGHTHSELIDINDAGVAVGYSRGGGNPSRAVRWNAGSLQPLSQSIGAEWSEGYSINNLGQIVGSGRGFWDGVSIKLLPPLMGFSGAVPEKINNAGKVVGWSFNSGELQEHPTLWDGNTVVYIGNLPGYERGIAESVNAAGKVVGWGQHADSITNPRRAFLWNAGNLSALNAASGQSECAALAINDHDAIVGYSGSLSIATVWENGNPIAINTRLAPQWAAWRITIAYDINNAGQIVGQGIGPDNIRRAVLLNPDSIYGPDTEDADRDGLLNLLEFATNSDPAVPNPPPGQLMVNGSNLEFRYNRSKAAVQAGIITRVEWRDRALVYSNSWNSGSVTESVTDPGEATPYQIVTATLPAGQGRRFVRLKVIRP